MTTSLQRGLGALVLLAAVLHSAAARELQLRSMPLASPGMGAPARHHRRELAARTTSGIHKLSRAVESDEEDLSALLLRSQSGDQGECMNGLVSEDSSTTESEGDKIDYAAIASTGVRRCGIRGLERSGSEARRYRQKLTRTVEVH